MFSRHAFSRSAYQRSQIGPFTTVIPAVKPKGGQTKRKKKRLVYVEEDGQRYLIDEDKWNARLSAAAEADDEEAAMHLILMAA